MKREPGAVRREFTLEPREIAAPGSFYKLLPGIADRLDAEVGQEVSRWPMEAAPLVEPYNRGLAARRGATPLDALRGWKTRG
jgi:hypothetical protein